MTLVLCVGGLCATFTPQAYSDDARVDSWLSRVKSSVSARDLDLLRRAALTLQADIASPKTAYDADGQNSVGGRALSFAGQPLPWSPLRGIYPSPFKYHGVWSWDGPFHAIAVARWDPQLAREQFEILLRFQQPSGALPDVIMENSEVVTNFGKPPVIAWAIMRVDEIAPDKTFLAKAYPKLVALERHWMKNRGGNADGLFHYGGTLPNLESGWDTSVRWDHGCDSLWAVDLNCVMVTFYDSMAYIARRLDLKEDQTQWLEHAKELGFRIDNTLWNETAGAYMDCNRVTRKFTDVLSPASFMPLYVNIPNQQRATRLAKLAADPAKFFPGLPSVSYNNPAYRSSDYWRGPTWLNVSYFALKGLRNYGYDKIANNLRETILGWCDKNKDYLWEYYDSRDGKGLGAPQYGWTGTFLIEFILDW
ncbi:MAG: hypothetical protein M1608_04185 [Candidatus Omnitrophica bacterium]|nr:hypothetical protein [Candidatus Omnitrophota bacterium]